MARTPLTTSDLPGTTLLQSAGNSVVTVRPDLLRHLGVATRLAAAAPALGTVGGMLLRTERLTLRPLLASDRAEFLRVLRLSRAHLAEFCPLTSADAAKAETDEQIFDRHLALSNAATQTGRAWRAGMFDADGRLVGAVNINDIARGLENTGELVFWLSADATRRGYAHEATRAAIEFALADLPRGLGLQRVTALIAPANRPCLALSRKLAMTLDPASPPTLLTLGPRQVSHDTYHIYASVVGESRAPTSDDEHVVEGKPSIADDLFGRGLLSILRTEASAPAAITSVQAAHATPPRTDEH